MKLAKNRKLWPRLTPPVERGRVTVDEVFRAQRETVRDEAAVEQAIGRWCASVWESWKISQDTIRELVKQELNIEVSRRA
jgi:hypothetical protein